ncbi:hypothetical protein KI387_012563, partial [Taxus chinensis]
MIRIGFGQSPIIIGEIGCPSDGAIVAKISNEKRFNQGLVNHVLSNKGIPLRPGVPPMEVYLFGLLDEGQKSVMPTNFERHWGIYTFDGHHLDLGKRFKGLVNATNVPYLPSRWSVTNSNCDLSSASNYAQLACSSVDCTRLLYGGSCNDVGEVAMIRIGFGQSPIIIGEIGCPSDGAIVANISNEKRFNQGLVNHVLSNKGIPLRPGVPPMEVYLFGLLDEGQKSFMPTNFERHWGIYTFDGHRLDLGKRFKGLVNATNVPYLPSRWCVANSNCDLSSASNYAQLACSSVDCTRLLYGGSCNDVGEVAMIRIGFGQSPIIIGEIGCPSDGAVVANISNEKRFNQGLVNHVLSNKGIPLRPGVPPMEVYLFGLLDEGQKSVMPMNFERHWGIYTFDGHRLYLGKRFKGLVNATNVPYLPSRWCVANSNCDLSSASNYAQLTCSSVDCTRLLYGESCNDVGEVAMIRIGFGQSPIIIGEIGCPSDGAIVANISNEKRFNQGLVNHVLSNKGIPLRPGVPPMEVYLFGLLDEGQKSVMPTNFERHWGIYTFDSHRLDLGKIFKGLVNATNVPYLPSRWCVANSNCDLSSASNYAQLACSSVDCTRLLYGGSCNDVGEVAMIRIGFGQSPIIIREIGCPSDGAIVANISNEKRFNQGLVNHVLSNKGIPLRPGVPPMEVYLFGLLDEGQKSFMPTNFERHWGIYTFDGHRLDLGKRFKGLVNATNVPYLPSRWCVENSNCDLSSASNYAQLACSSVDCTRLLYGGSCNDVGEV